MTNNLWTSSSKIKIWPWAAIILTFSPLFLHTLKKQWKKTTSPCLPFGPVPFRFSFSKPPPWWLVVSKDLTGQTPASPWRCRLKWARHVSNDYEHLSILNPRMVPWKETGQESGDCKLTPQKNLMISVVKSGHVYMIETGWQPLATVISPKI